MEPNDSEAVAIVIRPSAHFRWRAARRALRDEVLEFVMRWGEPTRAAGATHWTIVRNELPAELRNSATAAAAERWIIVADDDGSLITCYRREDAWRFVRRKSQIRRRLTLRGT